MSAANEDPAGNAPTADAATFLLEIGVEELPSDAIAPAVEQFQASLLARLDAERLPVPAEHITTYATPRRLAFIVRGLAARQPDIEQEVRGPSVKAAYAPDGAPTKAAEGFATKNGVAVSELTTSGEYVVARKWVTGRPTGEVLAEAIPELLKTIVFPKFMRWGEGNYRFGRPLRRFVALLGDTVVDFEVEGVRSGRETVGHRFLSDGPIFIPYPDAYADTLRAASVEPDPARRRDEIRRQCQLLAQGIGGRAVLPDALVEENVYLTEWVTAVLGTFHEDFISLPRPVLEIAMKKHQRFFPVEAVSGSLLPFFIAIRNGNEENLRTVRGGYEKVLSSRFSDARFFFDHDRTTTLADKAVKMERIVFQEKLGTLADKTRRLHSILEATHLARWTQRPAETRRAAELSKVDLASEIVSELPALQGVMGREYALLDGEPEAVAEALLEQYLPRSASDVLPRSRVGIALALADRVDTLVGYMTFVGAEPKGSSDLFGLKRTAGAIIDMLARDRTLPGISALLSAAEAAYVAQGLTRVEKPGALRALLEVRLRGLLEERGIRHDLVDALVSSYWDSIASVVKRADVLEGLLRTSREMEVAQAATRVRNILKGVQEELPDIPDIRHLKTPEERTLLAFLNTVTPQVEKDLKTGDYTDALDTLAGMNGAVNRLFDAVLINAEDPDIRCARLALLARADRLYLGLADFSRIVLE